MIRFIAIVAACSALAACGGGSAPAEDAAENLEAAAEQSDPAAAAVLENAADEIGDADGAEANEITQRALEQAGNAQAATGAGRPQAAPPSRQAQPHRPGDPVPPPTSATNQQ